MQEIATSSRAATSQRACEGETVVHSAGAMALRVMALVDLLLLLVQFILGMLLNLFVEISSPLPSSGGVLQAIVWSLGQSNMPILVVHIVLGMALVVISILSLVLSITGRQWKWIAFSAIAVLGILLATVSGAGFVNTGAPASSMAMSIGFLLALLSYAIGLYMIR